MTIPNDQEAIKPLQYSRELMEHVSHPSFRILGFSLPVLYEFRRQLLLRGCDAELITVNATN